ncbi:MAG: N-acetylneuraminate synthase family protein [Thermoanaerobaculia bacterium]|nr:N-acetylneuraminate synthase family protein [Thermoanaerobaculia bacterium]
MSVDDIQPVRIADRPVGPGHPTYVIAEIGVNHNGEMELAKKLIDAAAVAGCDAVKFQKRTPEICVPEHQRERIRETPWGTMTYMEYKERIEFGRPEFEEIDRYCRDKGIHWFASPWDVPSVDFLEEFEPVCHKVASASLTDEALLTRIADTGRPVILSTGMSTMDEIRNAVSILGTAQLIVTHCTSAYPCPPDELNLRMVETLASEFGCPIGYSGHEVGLQTTVATVVLGACLVERHITLDRAMWGSDQSASVEPWGFMRLVRDIRVVERALGDGEKRIYDSELPIRERLRR